MILPRFWCTYMPINVRVEYNGGVLSDIILFTRCYYHRGTRLNAIKRLCPCSLCCHLNVLTNFPPDQCWGGCSEGLLGMRSGFLKNGIRKYLVLPNCCLRWKLISIFMRTETDFISYRPTPMGTKNLHENGPNAFFRFFSILWEREWFRFV